MNYVILEVFEHNTHGLGLVDFSDQDDAKIVENKDSFIVTIEETVTIPKSCANSYKFFNIDGAHLLLFEKDFDFDFNRIEKDYLSHWQHPSEK